MRRKKEKGFSREELLPWMQKNVPAEVREEGLFTDLLTNLLLVFDRGLAPSSHTLGDLEWACQADARLQEACLWGACKCFRNPSEFLFFYFFISSGCSGGGGTCKRAFKQQSTYVIQCYLVNIKNTLFVEQ